MSDLEEQKPGVSRRTVAKAMAWSVPAVALAVPTPAYAASPGVIQLTGGRLQAAGKLGRLLQGLRVPGISPTRRTPRVTVTITGITLDGEDMGDVAIISLPPSCALLGTNTFVLPANTTIANVAFLTQDAASSENGTLVVTYTVEEDPDQATATADGLPPIQGDTCRENVFSRADAACMASLAA